LRGLPTAREGKPRHWSEFFSDLSAYRALGGEAPQATLMPCLGDKSGGTPFDPHYTFQAAWATRRLTSLRARYHVDVGSDIRWVATLSQVLPVVFVEIRPASLVLSGLLQVAGSLIALPFADASVGCLSCLHVIEHVGLGRYGDGLDPEGSVRAARELQRVLAPGGHLLLSCPVGQARTCFNAHRIHEPETVVAWFHELKLIEFSVVSDAGALVEKSQLRDWSQAHYACGLFHFVRSA
jgi:SAM-dependent methyltransferase